MDRSVNANRIPVVFAANDGFAAPLAAALASLARANRSLLDVRIFYLPGRLSSRNRQKLRFAESPSLQITFQECAPQATPPHPNPRITPETCLRFQIPERLPEYGRALYLDCDILVFSDLSELYHTPLSRPVAAVVNDEAEAGYCDTALGLARGEYFNAGMLLMDLTIFRREDIGGQCLRYLREHPKARYQDEEALNVVLRGRWQSLPLRWNLQWKLHTLKCKEGAADAEAYAFGGTGILHYAGNEKPWEFPQREYASCYREALSLTPYREMLSYPRFSIVCPPGSEKMCGVTAQTIPDTEVLPGTLEAILQAKGQYLLFTGPGLAFAPHTCEWLYARMQEEYTDILAFPAEIDTDSLERPLSETALADWMLALLPFPQPLSADLLRRCALDVPLIGPELWDKCFRTAAVKRALSELGGDENFDLSALFPAIVHHAESYRPAVPAAGEVILRVRSAAYFRRLPQELAVLKRSLYHREEK